MGCCLRFAIFSKLERVANGPRATALTFAQRARQVECRHHVSQQKQRPVGVEHSPATFSVPMDCNVAAPGAGPARTHKIPDD